MAITTVYYEIVAPGNPSGSGAGTLSDPLLIAAGAAGDVELDAYLDAIEAIQGTRPSAQPASETATKTWSALAFSSVASGLTPPTPAQYLAEVGIAKTPSVHTLKTAEATATVYHVGKDRDGNDWLAYTIGGDFIVARCDDDLATVDLSVDLNGWGDTYPVSTDLFQSLIDDNPAAMYKPKAVRIHEGCIMVDCAVTDRTIGTATLGTFTGTLSIVEGTGAVSIPTATFQTDTWNNGGLGVYVRISNTVSNNGLHKINGVTSETVLDIESTNLTDEFGISGGTVTLEVWEQNSRSAMVSKDIGGSTWSVGASDYFPSDQNIVLGNVWMTGQPIVVNNGGQVYMMKGSTNYVAKDVDNSGQHAYVDQWRDLNGSWIYTGRALIDELLDATRSAGETHYHTVHLYWDGTNIRAKLAIGDGLNDNGIKEWSIAGTSIFAAGAQVGLSENFYDKHGDWTAHGFIHGNNYATGVTAKSPADTFRVGAQPTWFITADGRTHLGSDEGTPAIVSFDEVGRSPGDALDDLRTEYLGCPATYGTGAMGYVSLSADCDDPIAPTRMATIVAPSLSYGDSDATEDTDAMAARQLAATRIAYFRNGKWFTIAQKGIRNTAGIGVDSDGFVWVGGTGVTVIEPGTLAIRTPAVSSPGGTNAIVGAISDSVQSSRCDFSNPTPGGSEPDLPDGVDATAVLAKFESSSALAVANGTLQTRLTEAGTAQYFSDSISRAQVRVRTKNHAGHANNIGLQVCGSGSGAGQNIDAFDAGVTDRPTGASMGNGWAASRTATTASTLKVITNDWINHSEVMDRRASLTGSSEIVLKTLTSTANLEYSAISSFYEVLDAVFIDPTQRIFLDADYGAVVLDTDYAWSGFPTLPFPLTVVGVTHPDGSTSRAVNLRQNELLFRLYKDANNYVEVNFDPENNRLELAYNIAGAGETLDSLGDVEWTRQTDVLVQIDLSGSDLTVKGSVYGNPWGTAVTIAGGALADWSGAELRQYDGSQQGALMLAEISAETGATTEVEGQPTRPTRNRTRSRAR